MFHHIINQYKKLLFLGFIGSKEGRVEEEKKIHELFVTRKDKYDGISEDLKLVLKDHLGIKGIKGIKVFNHYIVDGLTDKEFEKSKNTIFSEAPVNDSYNGSDFYSHINGKTTITIEAKPGQYDNRVDAVESNLNLQTDEIHNARVRKVVVIDGNISDKDKEEARKFLTNPVECYNPDLFHNKSLDRKITKPENHKILKGFTKINKDSKLKKFIKEHELSIELKDIKLIQEYFRDEEKRDPTLTEIAVIETYWSDHCRHTTFETKIEKLEFEGNKELIEDVKKTEKYFKENSKKHKKSGDTFMQIAQASLRFLKDDPEFKGKDDIDVSIENNCASYKTEIELENGKKEKWIIMFKNETHNSPTDKEPFGGAATCLGGAIRDLLSGRSIPFQCMRISGSSNPTEPITETLKGKLAQRAIAIGAALGYASYGNQIGLATGRVQEYFHPGYVAKRFECGFVTGAVKEKNLKREKPKKGDLIIMCGGRTGADGVGGASVSSTGAGKMSDEKVGSHVQKGNPVEERKFVRLMDNERFIKLIKKSNDFGAGGVSVAIGEMARSLDIDLDIIAKHTKYAGLNDKELAISESQERMGFLIDPKDYEEFMSILKEENIEGFIASKVTNHKNKEKDRLIMNYQGKEAVNIKRSFLDRNGYQRKRKAKIVMKKPEFFDSLDGKVKKCIEDGDYKGAILEQLSLLQNSLQRGLGGGFDNSVGASNILAPYGGKYQTSPQIGMASKVPTFDGVDAKTAIISTNGLNPYLLSENTYIGGMYSIIEAISKVVAMGGDYKKTWVSLQEYFATLTTDEKYGEVYAGLLGTLKALIEIKIAAIGGKDSMSGDVELEDGEIKEVPPTIATFASTPVDSDRIVSAEFKKPGSKVYCLSIEKDENGLPNWKKYIENLDFVNKLIKDKKILSSSVVDQGGIITSISKMMLGNRIGFKFDDLNKSSFLAGIGDIIIEVESETEIIKGKIVGETVKEENLIFSEDKKIDIGKLQRTLERKLDDVWKTTKNKDYGKVTSLEQYKKRTSIDVMKALRGKSIEKKEKMNVKPKALLPVFPGTNSELDTRHALIKAGFDVVEHVFYTAKRGISKKQDKKELEREKKSREKFAKLLKKTNLLVFSGGFSAGDEPDGSAKTIVNTIKTPEIRTSLQQYFKNKNKLTLGICNGFQGLIKMGVFDEGNIKDELKEEDETLTLNTTTKHQTELVKLKVASILSPFAKNMEAGDEFLLPISHGEGNIIISEKRYKKYLKNGQIPLQYLNEEGKPTNKYNGSFNGIAALTNQYGNIMGLMPHIERNGLNVFKNVPGDKLMPILDGAYESLTGMKYKKVA